jgi:hypothetical protein
MNVTFNIIPNASKRPLSLNLRLASALAPPFAEFHSQLFPFGLISSMPEQANNTGTEDLWT